MNDWDQFLLSIPADRRRWLDSLPEDERKQRLSNWYWWWINVGRDRGDQGELFGEESPYGPARENPDPRARKRQREAGRGGLGEQAAYLMERLRSGSLSWAHVSLAAVYGSKAARSLDPPPFSQQYLKADRMAFAEWGAILSVRVPSIGSGGSFQLGQISLIEEYLFHSKKPPAASVREAPEEGPGAIASDAIRIIRARSGLSIHQYVQRMIENYRVRVYQRFMDELAGHHEGQRDSPAWTLTDRQGQVVTGQQPRVAYDVMRMRGAAVRQATGLLVEILLKE